MIPLDHVLLKKASALPAIIVTQLPNGLTHFVVVWRVLFGRWVQIMDPSTGRRWIPIDRFLETVYYHRFAVPAETWYEWAKSQEFLEPLSARMAALGLNQSSINQIIKKRSSTSDWIGLAALGLGQRIEHAKEPVEADGGTIERRKINVTHGLFSS